MEVHHHSHIPKSREKKWTHYFWEFLMLFLAVFCGFLAEYQLEHKIEKDRAKELAKSFYEELKGDSIAIRQVMQNRLRKDSAIRYLANFFQDSSIKNPSKAFGINYTIAFMVISSNLFEPRNAILDQLKNSGSLRYFKSRELQVLTGNLAVAIANLKSRHETERNYQEERIMPFLIRHNDFQWISNIWGNGQTILLRKLEEYEKSGEIKPFAINNIQMFNKAEALNMLQLHLIIIQTTRINQYAHYEILNHKLLEELRKQYNMK